MTTKFSKHVSKKAPTPQTKPIPGREDEQVKNSAGGYVFETGDWKRLDRFLILGSEGGTYYVNENKLTVDNTKAIRRCIKEDGQRVVDTILAVSTEGRAPKNDPALFALALCVSADDVKTRQAALRALPSVARIGTHLFHFVEFVTSQRGWGRALRNAIGESWYQLPPVEKMAMQMAKYQSRDGWSHRDLLRLSHPKVLDRERRALFAWALGREVKDGKIDVEMKSGAYGKTGLRIEPVTIKHIGTPEELPSLIQAFERLKADPDNVQLAVKLIVEHGLPRECLPTQLLNNADIWRTLLIDMPLQAMVRNLGKMSSIGLLKPLSSEVNLVTEKLKMEAIIRKSRLHPMSLLLALKQYGAGHGNKGKLSWTPVPQIVDALDDAFYLAFKNVIPTGKNIFIGIDVSGSMSVPFMDSPLKVCEAAAAMAMTVARSEQNYFVMGFADGLRKIDITAKSRLRDVLKQTENINWGGTDCALPMQYAQRMQLDVDAFVVLTDNETYAGRFGHACQALQSYRQQRGRNAKLVVVGMTSSGFTIADPKDPGMLDVVGFDSATPQVIADFIRE